MKNKMDIPERALIFLLLTAVGCGMETIETESANENVTVSAEIRITETGTRTIDPDEEKITDLNIFAFDGDGNLEYRKFIGSSGLSMTEGGVIHTINWIAGKECQIYACANFGFSMSGIGNLDDLLAYRYYLSYPDEYSRGIPMGGSSGKVMISAETRTLTIPMIRMMSKISLSVDRSALSKNVKFNVRSVRIGGCPKSANVFTSSRAMGSTDIFGTGFMKTYSETDDLNVDQESGKSREVSVYMLENMQGDLLPDAVEEKDKVPDMSDAAASVCSYIEIKAEYQSDSLYSKAGEYLIYRFFLGNGPSNFDVERNCHYMITVKPQGSGVAEDSWRVDKTGLTSYSKAAITVHPSNYIEGKTGEDIHVWADVTPTGTRFSIGLEELEYDKGQGIYDYTLDEDGHGVTLHLKEKGSGILYFEAGAPVTAAEMVVIVVN